jgi:hypothetical protein
LAADLAAGFVVLAAGLAALLAETVFLPLLSLADGFYRPDLTGPPSPARPPAGPWDDSSCPQIAAVRAGGFF